MLNTETNTTTEKKTAAEDAVRSRIVSVAAKATDDEKKMTADIIREATSDNDYRPACYTLSPSVAALLFLNHNPHNRDWNYLWSLELERRIVAGQWEENGDTIRFYTDGQVADGQHRLAAIALYGQSCPSDLLPRVPVIVVFGLNRNAIVTVDNAKRRHAADAAKLNGIADSTRKESVIKFANSYMIKAGERVALLKSETEIEAAIRAENDALDEAIAIGRELSSNKVFAKPVLKESQVSNLAYLMLKGGWPTLRIKEKIALVQACQSNEGEHQPYFVAASLLWKARDASSKRERLSGMKEVGVVLYAMVQAEMRITSVHAKNLKAAVASSLPRPNYPGEQLPLAA